MSDVWMGVQNHDRKILSDGCGFIILHYNTSKTTTSLVIRVHTFSILFALVITGPLFIVRQLDPERINSYMSTSGYRRIDLEHLLPKVKLSISVSTGVRTTRTVSM